MRTFTETKLIPKDPDDWTVTGMFPDGTCYRVSATRGGVVFAAAGESTDPFPREQAQGLYSVEAGNGYRVYLEYPGRRPSDAFGYRGGRLVLEDPDALSPDDWRAMAGAFRRLGYDTKSPDTARLRFSELVRENRNDGRHGFTLRPDQQAAVEALWYGADGTAADAATAHRLSVKAGRKYGLTTDWTKAGYLRTDGQLLNFSHEGRQRDMDHREVNELFADGELHDKPGGNIAGMLRFMSCGNIRVTLNGLDLMVRPTPKQEAAIRRFCRYYRVEPVCVEFTTPTGGTAATARFGPMTDPETVINTIRSYFDTGFLPGELTG